MIAALMILASTSVAVSPVRIVDADQRKACKYLGLASGNQSGSTRNAERAIGKAMKRVEKAGGNSLYIVAQSDNWLEGTQITGEALDCPTP